MRGEIMEKTKKFKCSGTVKIELVIDAENEEDAEMLMQDELTFNYANLDWIIEVERSEG